MADAIDPKLLDKRVAGRFIKRGLLNEKDYERHLKSPPDLSEQAAPIEATIEPMNVGTGSGNHPGEEE